ncbi:VAMP-associated protein 33kDa [Colletes latitarsis]|uniref:VAMP-associated protein 33kDa n=1 Tax=Colletes latitarsis TaxID=2605962 RepID=UPI00403619D5
MVRPQQVLEIKPENELRFTGPFTEKTVTSYLSLYNPTDRKVYFKIKTTAPRRYCVRPNCGYIKPKRTIQIAVSLQPFDYDSTEKNKHKFMVQSLLAPADDTGEDYLDMWKDPNPTELMESKLKCVFENPVTCTTSAKTAANKSEASTSNGKNKSVSIKQVVKDNVEAEDKLLKVAQEVNQLRVEESTLRQENLQLKEDLIKLQNAASGYDANVAAAILTSQSSSQLSQNYTNIFVFVAIVMVIVGYLLGKMF